MIKVLGLALYGPMAASHRYRLRQYKEGLKEKGIDLEIFHLLGDDYLENKFSGKPIPIGSLFRNGFGRLFHLLTKNTFDVSILYCELFPFLPGVIEKILLPKPYIYDFDDAFYLKYRSGRFKFLSPFLNNKFNKIITGAAAVTAGNRHLVSYAKDFNKNTIYFPTVVDTEVYRMGSKEKVKTLCIGWVGSPSTAPYLKQLIHPLSEFGKKNKVQLRVIGGDPPEIPNIEVISIPWKESDVVSNINRFDVGVMPLHDDEWSRGKCAFKLIQYMACGKPVIASNVGANRDLISPENGFLVNNDEEWIQALEKIKDNPDVLKKLGINSRKTIEESYSLKINLPILSNLIIDINRLYNR